MLLLRTIEADDGRNAQMPSGTTLYRVASLSHCDADALLAGEGTSRSDKPGRFNAPQQRTSYCANNVLVCLAEILYHRYRQLLDAMTERNPIRIVKQMRETERCLVVCQVNAISSLVVLESEDFRAYIDGHICGTTAVFPDPDYKLYKALNFRMREEAKSGVVYPSARHSRDWCVALFNDHSDKLKEVPYLQLRVVLSLMHEDQDIHGDLEEYDASREKTHATMGHYRFVDEDAFRSASEDGWIYPSDLPVKGFVDFVRRHYENYPDDAVC